MKTLFLTAIASLLTITANAEFKAGYCTQHNLKSQICVYKESSSKASLSVNDVIELRRKFENSTRNGISFPWMDVLDSDGKGVDDLAGLAHTIQRADRARYYSLIAKLEDKKNPKDYLEAMEIFLRNNPGQQLAVPSPNAKLMRQFADFLNGDQDLPSSISNASNDNAQASSYKESACTRDLNEYNHAGSCFCKTGYKYNEVTGMCDLSNRKAQPHSSPSFETGARQGAQ